MLWEGRALRDIRDGDVRRVVDSGLEEHLQLEYKSELYGDDERGRREFLLDVCMFANTAGGLLLIGIPERRDDDGQPTGVPDPAGVLGLEIPNPGLVLSGYDARVMEAIEERLPLESAAIDLSQGRRVLAIRVPNSANKPHSVQYHKHIYFTGRRERQRYNMTVRDIKELTIRTASRLHQAQDMLLTSFFQEEHFTQVPSLLMGIIPVFFEDFLIDSRSEAVRQAVARAGRAEGDPEIVIPDYTFNGLERRGNRHIVELRRNGLLRFSVQLPLHPRQAGETTCTFVLTATDALLHNFMSRARAIYEAARIGAPFALGMMLRTRHALAGTFAGVGGHTEYTEPISANDYPFPFSMIDDLSNTDREIRPLCDQAHQMFGRDGSPSFNAEGTWTANY